MRTTFPTFSPTTDHAGLTGRILNPLIRYQLPLLGSNQDSSDPESSGSRRHLGTTTDYGSQRRATGTNGSPLSSPLSHRKADRPRFHVKLPLGAVPLSFSTTAAPRVGGGQPA